MQLHPLENCSLVLTYSYNTAQENLKCMARLFWFEHDVAMTGRSVHCTT